MTDTANHQIWKPETGITGLETDPTAVGASEIPGIKAIWNEQRQRLNNTPQLQEFTDRLSREWAIETGIVENLYDIDPGVTETLIEHGFQEELLTHGPSSKPREFVIQLLRDQKDALDGVFDFVKSNRELSLSYIKELHAALLRSQETTEGEDTLGRKVQTTLLKGDWKLQPNFPKRNGKVIEYCPPERTADQMEALVEMHAGYVAQEIPGEVRAAWLHHRFTQIHPFQDGNGRVARALASLVLIKDGLFPLVVTREDRNACIKALEAADNGELKSLIDLIVKLQMVLFRKATMISEAVLVEGDLAAAIKSLDQEADRRVAEKLHSFREVFELADLIEKALCERLDEAASHIKPALQKVSGGANVDVYVRQSTENDDFWFRTQIVRNAKHHLDYYADTSEYRSWVALQMRWSASRNRSAKLVFTIHGFGKPFNGSLICAPFLEFRDTDDEGEKRNTFVPVAEEGLVFFYNEDQDRLLSRFGPWRDTVLQVAIRELQQNL